MKKILVAAAVMACFGTAGAAEDITVDVAVIGAGGAGLSAAVQAHELGANVVVVEKMAMVGGNTVRAAGGLNAVGTALQQAKGTKDSVEIMFYDTMKGGHWLNDPALVRTLVTKSRRSPRRWSDGRRLSAPYASSDRRCARRPGSCPHALHGC